MKAPKKYFVFIAMNCLFTLITQVIYNYEPVSDSLRFLKLADQYTHLNFFDPETNCYGHAFYAVFLGIIGTVFSYSHFVIGAVQTVIFTISCLLLINELESALKKNLIWTTIILFLVPEIHFYNGFVLTESLTFSLIILVFYFSYRIYNTEAGLKNMLILAFVFAIAVLNRLECIVVLLPVLYLIYPKINAQIGRWLVILFFPLVIILLLNGLRNYYTYNIFKVSAFNGGEVIYGGNNNNLDGSHHKFWENKQVYIPANKINSLDSILLKPECLSCPQRDSFYLHLALESWKNSPLEQMSVIPDKLAKNWLLPGNFDIYTADTTKTKGLQLKKLFSKEEFNNAWYAPYKHFFYLMIHWLLLIIITMGIFKIDTKNRFQKSVLILLLIYILFAIPFCGLPRWHVAIFPVLIICFVPQITLRFLKNKTVMRIYRQ